MPHEPCLLSFCMLQPSTSETPPFVQSNVATGYPPAAKRGLELPHSVSEPERQVLVDLIGDFGGLDKCPLPNNKDSADL